MARYLSDLPESENEVHEYLFETWQMGYKICECTYTNLNEARRYYANNGDFVVALLEDSVTVKTYYKEEDHFRLQPENDTMSPIIVKELEILGKVIGLFRMFS